MINGDQNNALQCALQIFLEVDELGTYFEKPKAESLNGLHVLMKRLYALTYREIETLPRKPINLKHMRKFLKRGMHSKRNYHALDIIKHLI